MPFPVRLIHGYTKSPSQAFTMCTPWTRLLTEAESPSDNGHVIGDEIALRKTTGQFNIITAIEMEQLQGDTTKAQRYLHASAWWLHRTPFGVERLPVKLVAQKYEGSLVSVDGWNVTSLVVDCDEEGDPAPLESLDPLAVNLKELRLAGIQISDLTPFCDVEILSVNRCPGVRDLSGLQGCRHLRVLDVSWTGVADLSALAEVLSLEELDCSGTRVTSLAPLATCRNLKKLRVAGCSSFSDLSPLSGLRLLERIDVSRTRIATLAPLATCCSLKKVMCGRCESLKDLSSLAGAPALEEIQADWGGVTTITGLATCAQLNYVDFSKCASLHDLSPLAGAPALEEIFAYGSAVTTITGLDTCPKLTALNLESTPCAQFSR